MNTDNTKTPYEIGLTGKSEKIPNDIPITRNMKAGYANDPMRAKAEKLMKFPGTMKEEQPTSNADLHVSGPYRKGSTKGGCGCSKK